MRTLINEIGEYIRFAMLHIRARRTAKKGEAREEEGEGGDEKRGERSRKHDVDIFSISAERYCATVVFLCECVFYKVRKEGTWKARSQRQIRMRRNRRDITEYSIRR